MKHTHTAAGRQKHTGGFWTLSAAFFGLVLGSSVIGFMPMPVMSPVDACFWNTNVKSLDPPELQPCGRADCDSTGEPDYCVHGVGHQGSQRYEFCACTATPPWPDSVPCMAVLSWSPAQGWEVVCISIGGCTTPPNCKGSIVMPVGYTYHCSCQV